ncbi:hypothetical protein [Streptomyces cinereoruber]|uniref:hypothetical protein n=1 Tax=Streptomyces cinereoruber TaxID=67260 RepID=UPI003C2AFA85
MLVGAELQTVVDVRRMAGLLPDTIFDYVRARTDPVTGGFLSFDMDVYTATDEELAAEVPLDFVRAALPAGVDGEEFVHALGSGPASVQWEGRWPDEPKLGS